MTTCSGFYLDQVSSKIVQTVHKNNFAWSRFLYKITSYTATPEAAVDSELKCICVSYLKLGYGLSILAQNVG